MSDRTFPAFDGIFESDAEPFFVNAEQTSENGRRLSVKKRTAPGYRYKLDVQYLRPWLNEPRDVFDFFVEHGGSYESFLYTAKDGVTRRVHFVDDDLGLKRENGGVYTGEITLETVVF